MFGGGCFEELLELVAADDPHVRPILLCLQDRRLPLPRQILEAFRVEQHLVELPALKLAHFAERRVADYLPDAAAQRGAGHWWSLDRAGIWGVRVRAGRPCSLRNNGGRPLRGEPLKPTLLPLEVNLLRFRIYLDEVAHRVDDEQPRSGEGLALLEGEPGGVPDLHNDRLVDPGADEGRASPL